MNIPVLYRRLKKSKSLHIVNLLGLVVIFACVLLSYQYISKELSYDRFNENAGRIARLSLQFGDRLVDGRLYVDDIASELQDIPEIEQFVSISKGKSAILTYAGQSRIVNDFYVVSPNFFEVFSYPLAEGNRETAMQQRPTKMEFSDPLAGGNPSDAPSSQLESKHRYTTQTTGNTTSSKTEKKSDPYRYTTQTAANPSDVLSSPESVLVSRSLARELFGNENPIGKELSLGGRSLALKTYFVSGVFDDFPENSHFHTDLLIKRKEDNPTWTYVYLLLNDKNSLPKVKQSVEAYYNASEEITEEVTAHLMPLTDIHLHSRLQREMEPNGNINYIYLIAGANILLLIVVLFNVWLNNSLLFSYNKRYYRLLRLNGADSATLLFNEAIPAMLTGLLSVLLGGMAAYYLAPLLHFTAFSFFSPGIMWITLCFLVLVVSVSLIPALSDISSTLLISTQDSVQPSRFSFANIRYMLVAQYAIVMFIVIISTFMSKQLDLIKTEQVGGKTEEILVIDEQPEAVNERFGLLKTELLKHPEIEQATTAFQLPGDAIRDGVFVTVEGESESKFMPIMVAGEDFLPFFGIKPIAGKVFDPMKMSYKEEFDTMTEFLGSQSSPTGLKEEYMLNRKALDVLGFRTPEEAIGKTVQFSQGTIDYVNTGTICGVTDDFTYINMYDESIPLLMMQRQMFQHCFMLKFAPGKQEEGLQVFLDVWGRVNPDYPPQYTFLQDVYGKVYRNEINAGRLVNLFSLLCLVIANLGLILFMAFIVKRRRKEIAIRKVNGAHPGQIIRMLNGSFIYRIVVAFVIAVPLAYWVMQQWLAHFAFKTTLHWWVFLLAGAAVLLLSVAAVSWQSWRASVANPVEAL